VYVMPPELFIAVLAGLGGMVGWGIADFFAKKSIDNIGDVTTLFWGQLIGIVPLSILYLLNPVSLELGGLSWLFLVLLGVWAGLSYIPTYVAFRKGKVSLLSPIFASYAVIVAIISATFFGEVIPIGIQISFAVVFVGVVLISGDPRDLWQLIKGKRESNKEDIRGLPEILLAVGLYSLWLIAFNLFISGIYWVPVLLVIRILSSFAIFIYAKWTHITLIIADKKFWKFVILIGVFDVAAVASISYGLSVTTYTSVVVMLAGAFSIPTIILARTFLKESATRLQTVGSIIAVAGIMLLSLL